MNDTAVLKDKKYQQSDHCALDYEVVVIGAGISGVGAAIQLKKHGYDSFLLLEAANDLGGTWRDNIYPGVAVDIPSVSYSYSFESNYRWSGLFAPGAEVLEYIRHCARKYKITDKIRYNSTVEKIVFCKGNNNWTLFLLDGTTLVSRFIISATGVLCQPSTPNIPGLASFKGKMMHTARWDAEYDVSNKKVGIIGTGASAVQIVPSIAPDVEHLTVFQRTPIWIGPRSDLKYIYKHNKVPGPSNSKRHGIKQRRWRMVMESYLEVMTYVMLNYDKLGFIVKKAQQEQKEFIESEVHDPVTQKKLVPDYPLGCKRPGFSSEYLKTYNRKNVALVTENIKCITENGILTSDGVEHALDTLILSTGFKPNEKGNSPSFEVVGLDDVELSQYWYDNRYQSYRSVSVPGFPNFFLTAGPHSGGLNWFAMLEAHLVFIMRCLNKAKQKNSNYVEVKQEAHDKYYKLMRKKWGKSVLNGSACESSNTYYYDKDGEPSLVAPFTPMHRWFAVRLSTLGAYKFE